jgi:hypothetical protein
MVWRRRNELTVMRTPKPSRKSKRKKATRIGTKNTRQTMTTQASHTFPFSNKIPNTSPTNYKENIMDKFFSASKDFKLTKDHWKIYELMIEENARQARHARVPQIVKAISAIGFGPGPRVDRQLRTVVFHKNNRAYTPVTIQLKMADLSPWSLELNQLLQGLGENCIPYVSELV